MQFLHTPENTYWEVDLNRMRLYNYNGGWHSIDENSEEWCDGEIVNADSWHDLYKQTGLGLVAWLSPEGISYPSEAHIVLADDICDILYGLDDEEYSDDYLVSSGWVKISNYMLSYYIDQGYYDNITPKQREVLLEWCRVYGINNSFLT